VIFPVFYLMLRPKPMETPCKKLKIPLAPADKIRYNAVGIENDFQYQAKGIWGTGEMAQPANISTVEEGSEELVTLDTGGARAPRKIILIGQPNVGKSLLFTNLTSHYVTISNYPGTTVEVFRGTAMLDGSQCELLDTPGVNGLEADSNDEKITVEILQSEKPDLLLQVADAKNLRRALLLTAQLVKFKIPSILVLNMMDECRKKGISIDTGVLSQRLGIPVVETVATTGEGLEALKSGLIKGTACPYIPAEPRSWADDLVRLVYHSRSVQTEEGFSRTTFLIAASIAGAGIHLSNYLGAWFGIRSPASILADFLNGFSLPELLTTALTVIVAYLLPVLVPALWALQTDAGFRDRFGVWARRPVRGTLILIVTVSLTFQLVGVLGAQIFVELLESGLFESWINPLLRSVIPAGFIHDLLMGPFGLISMGITYGIAIVLPVVGTFFIAFSVLEDSGYLPRLSILADRILRMMGLHGKAFLPMVLGLGCVTMATMTTRILNSKKERAIATFLLALAVPCSAQLGVILAITAGISGRATALVFGTVLLQLVIAGLLLSKILPGTRSNFVMELPPIRFPVWKNVFKKTYWRVVWFLKEALPLFVLGTFVLFILDRVQLLGRITSLAEPVVNRLLGLPSEAAAIFLMGFLRRDYGAAGLYNMAQKGMLDTVQIVVALVVITLFVPCVANSFVMIKEQGFKIASLMIGSILVYAFLVGGFLNLALRSLGSYL